MGRQVRGHEHQVFDNSYGYAVFPTIGKGGLGVGAAHGKGRVYAQGKYVGDTSMTQVSFGLQAGGQAYSQIIFFEDKRAFDEFTSGNFEFGAGVSAVAITAGASRSSRMSKGSRSVGGTLVAGILVVAPVYLGILLLLKAMESLAGLLKPIAGLLPDWVPGDRLLSLLLVLAFCYVVGLAIRTSPGHAVQRRLERSVFAKIPGYELFRSLTHQLAGESKDAVWKPALAEIEDALVPAFVIEELADGRYTVFVPSVPTPLAGAVYVLSHDRVHLLDIAFTQALMTISRWGSGCKDLVAAMDGAKQQNAAGEGLASGKAEPLSATRSRN
jgi:uncharacterized membrane protein